MADPIKIVEDALSYLMPHLTPGRTSGLHFNSDDEAAMLLRDAIFVLRSEKENTPSDVRKARLGYWQLHSEFEEEQ